MQKSRIQRKHKSYKKRQLSCSQILISNNRSQKTMGWHLSVLKGHNCHLELYIYKPSVISYGKINTFQDLQNRKPTIHTSSLKELLKNIFQQEKILNTQVHYTENNSELKKVTKNCL